jgi:hypothetical protein
MSFEIRPANIPDNLSAGSLTIPDFSLISKPLVVNDEPGIGSR